MSVEASEVINERRISLLSLFWIFLKIGSTAFGGFMALISVVQNYVVDREKLLTNEEMLDGISLATILPGPVAVNVVAYASYRINGVLGAIVCTTAVILPSFFLMLFLSYAYFKWGDIPAVNNIFQGFLPAVAAIIIAAVIKIGKNTINGLVEASLALTAMIVLISIGGFYTTLMIIVMSGVFGWVIYGNAETQSSETKTKSVVRLKEKTKNGEVMPFILIALTSFFVALTNSSSYVVLKLLSVFAGMSVLLFGGGFVFIPLMQESVVEVYNWVTHKEFVDAIAMGQVTPGPILISATFIGYKVAGVAGATLATVGIFAPPAVIMLICTHYLQQLKDSGNIQAVLKGIRCGVIGMIVAAAYIVGASAEFNMLSIGVFVMSLILLLVVKIEVAWIIPISGLIGYLFYA